MADQIPPEEQQVIDDELEKIEIVDDDAQTPDSEQEPPQPPAG